MEIGDACPEFACRATDGRVWATAELAGPKGLVIMFLSATCPYVLAQEQRILDLSRRMRTCGIGFAAVCSNTDSTLAPGNSFTDIRRHAGDRGYDFPYLYDHDQRLADTFDARCTPEFFAFDRDGRLHYRGRLDDDWRDATAVRHRWLEEALQGMMAGRPAPNTERPSFGCAVKRTLSKVLTVDGAFRRSDHLRVLDHAAGLRILHVLNGTEIEAGPDMLRFLEAFREPTTLSHVARQLPLPIEVEDVLRSLVASGFLVSEGADELASFRRRIAERRQRIRSGSLLSILRLNLATGCNLRCTYCYMEADGVGRQKANHSQLMSWSVAKRAVEMFLENARSNGRRHVTNRYIGGEPLLNRRVLKRTMVLAEERATALGIGVTHLLCTNGLLLDRPFVRFVRSLHDAHVLVSLDGIRSDSDRMRIDSQGRGVYNKVVAKIRLLLDEGVQVGVPAVVTRENYLGMERFLADMAHLGVRRVGLNPQYYLGRATFPTGETDALVDVLLRCRRAAQQLGLELSGKAYLPEWHSRNGHLANCEAMGRAVVVDPDGSLSLCDKIPERLGTVNDLSALLESPTYARFAMRVRTCIEACSNCEARWVCNGGCLADSLLARPVGTAQAVNCAFIRRMAASILLPLSDARASAASLHDTPPSYFRAPGRA